MNYRSSIRSFFFLCIIIPSSLFGTDEVLPEVATPSETTENAPKSAKRTRIVTKKPVKVACTRCRRLKVRCDNKQPSCKSCQKYKKTCVRKMTGEMTEPETDDSEHAPINPRKSKITIEHSTHAKSTKQPK